MKARYEYSCSICAGTVTKKPCGTVAGVKKAAAEITGIHGWSCQKCGKGVKVSRKMI